MRNHVVWVPGPTYLKLKELKERTGYSSFGSTIQSLALAYREGAAPKADLQAMLTDSRPFIVTGESGAGKTTLAKKALDTWTGPALVLDVSNEYDLPRIKDSRELDLYQFARTRIVTDASEDYSRIEAAYLFRDLAAARSNPELRKWLVVIEEAHRFADDPNLRNLVLEARKSIGKLLVLSADAKPWAGIAPVVRP